MNTETLQLAKEMLNELAVKLGTTAEMVYPYLLRQVTVEIVQTIVAVCVSVLVLVVGYKLIQTGRKISSSGDYRDTAQDFPYYLGGGILAAGGFLVGYSCLNTLIQLIMNPNYYIFAELIPNLLK